MQAGATQWAPRLEGAPQLRIGCRCALDAAAHWDCCRAARRVSQLPCPLQPRSPQYVPRSLAANQEVRMRAQQGAPTPCEQQQRQHGHSVQTQVQQPCMFGVAMGCHAAA